MHPNKRINFYCIYIKHLETWIQANNRYKQIYLFLINEIMNVWKYKPISVGTISLWWNDGCYVTPETQIAKFIPTLYMHFLFHCLRVFLSYMHVKTNTAFESELQLQVYYLNSMLNSTPTFHVVKWGLNINQLYDKCTRGNINSPAMKPAYPGTTYILRSFSHHGNDFNY